MHKTTEIPIKLWLGDKRAELENRAFDLLLTRYGGTELERRVARRQITRDYYRKLTREGWSRRVDVEDIDLTTGEDILTEIGGVEFAQEFKSNLSELERYIVSKLEEGYKPLDISRTLGRNTSNAVRWHKHNIKRKLIIFTENRPK